MASLSSTSAIAFVASGLPTARASSFSSLLDGSLVFAPSSLAPQPNLLGFCTIATLAPATAPTPVKPFLEEWQQTFPDDLSNVASPAVPSTPVNITRKSIASLHHSPSTASLSSFASTEPSTLFDFGLEEDAFSSSFSDSSSLATDFSYCAGDDDLDLESGESIFLNAFQAGIAEFSNSCASSSATLPEFASPSPHFHSSPPPVLRAVAAATSTPTPSFRYDSPSSTPFVRMCASAWDAHAMQNVPSLRARREWSY